MNSFRSAWTPVLAGLPEAHRQAKGDTEARPNPRPLAGVILSIKLVQEIGQAKDFAGGTNGGSASV
jgi:hypothetical protein